jgi:hypothetical protein
VPAASGGAAGAPAEGSRAAPADWGSFFGANAIIGTGATPEPASLTLLGLVGSGWRRRKQPVTA